jgi:hypothetical protein
MNLVFHIICLFQISIINSCFLCVGLPIELLLLIICTFVIFEIELPIELEI